MHADDLVKLCDLGRGAYGIVEKMHHKPSNTIMAVKVSYLIYQFTHLKIINGGPLLSSPQRIVVLCSINLVDLINVKAYLLFCF